MSRWPRRPDARVEHTFVRHHRLRMAPSIDRQHDSLGQFTFAAHRDGDAPVRQERSTSSSAQVMLTRAVGPSAATSLDWLFDQLLKVAASID